jgi:hypothetical protein
MDSYRPEHLPRSGFGRGNIHPMRASMPRPLVLIHGYSDNGQAFVPLRDALAKKGIALTDINVRPYITLNNEINIKDIAEGLERAFRNHPVLKDDPNL